MTDGPDVDLDADADEPDGDVHPVGLMAILGGYVAGFVLSTIVAIALLAGVDVAEGETAQLSDLPFSMLLFIQGGLWIGMLGLPWLIARSSGRPLLDRSAFRVDRRELGIAAAIGLGLQLIVIPLLYLPILYLLDDVDLSGPAREITDRAEGAANITVLVVLVVIGAPIVEETVFRGLLQPRLVRRLGPVAGIGVTAVIFAASHFQVVQFPALAVMGVVVGVLTHRLGRVGPAVVVHLFFNLTTVIVLVARG